MGTLRVPVISKDHIIGREDAPHTLVEYGDYQCPFCAMAHANIKFLMESSRVNFRLVFRHFPLTQVHEYAFRCAMGAEAAGLQGKFWEMHALIMENQDLVPVSGIEGFAEALSLDREKFERDLNDKALGSRIKEDFMGGVRSGVNGTPSFYLNGLKYDGPFEAEALEELLLAA